MPRETFLQTQDFRKVWEVSIIKAASSVRMGRMVELRSGFSVRCSVFSPAFPLEANCDYARRRKSAAAARSIRAPVGSGMRVKAKLSPVMSLA